MPWHVTPYENFGVILKQGLTPAIGPRSAELGEEVEAVHLFSRFDDLMDANWLDEAFEEDQRLVLFHVAHPPNPGAWTEVVEHIPPSKLRLISMDLDELTDNPALRALDLVPDAFADLESFRATRVSMRAEDYGKLVGDEQWAGSDETLLVYGAAYWIWQQPNGGYDLEIENCGWSTDRTSAAEGEELPETLETLERRLFEWVANEIDPEHDAPSAPAP